MGCSLSTFPVPGSIKHLEPSMKIDGNCISEHQKNLIKKTWRLLSVDMLATGSNIFLRIFAIKPSVKQIFPFKDVTGDALLKDTHFKGHALRFMQAVGAAVDNINALDSAMAPLLFSLGQQHVKFKGFNQEYFEVFFTAMNQEIQNELGRKCTQEVSTAWETMLEFMICKLRDGYTTASERKH